MLEELPIDYVLVYQQELPCRFAGRTQLDDVLEPVRRFEGEGSESIYVLRRSRTRTDMKSAHPILELTWLTRSGGEVARRED